MADIIDAAQAHEAQYLAHCLARAHAAEPAEPQEHDGQGRVICAKCGEPIPEARLKAMPTATRCVGCAR